MEEEINVGIIGNQDMRHGVYANTFNIAACSRDTYIDFAFLDGVTSTTEDGTVIHEGVHQARIIMTRSTLQELSDRLSDFLSRNGEEA